MLALRRGAGKVLLADPRPELNGRTLAAVAAGSELPVPAAVRRIIAAGNAGVMNLSMNGLAADFLRLDDRGYLRAGVVADIAVLDADRIRDRATYERPRQYAEGTVHVLVNGRFAVRDGEATGALAGRPIRRP